ncbi:protein kinase domain-containing protein [Neorhodopirellula pilleata]|uniref:Serine/threonine-protein kinase PrkC n=1 Tax=Neorhodopirellula pilleata TaxID=2714738 RepID=A0A5C6AWR7_9BACT|nr:protein kinase [Neorhodopirellula pilleata]TWU03589.1 Serine/threonine-protein kinase PrkC [Neorhodopirellula pilleata]
MSELIDSSSKTSNQSARTLPGFTSIVERLRQTNEFTARQLERIHQELSHFFENEDFSLDGSSGGIDMIGLRVGNFQLESLLGEGGAGQIFRARSLIDPSAYVALKIIKHVRSSSRFRREMELVQRLAHPNVVIAYEVGEQGDTLFIVMEELSGPDLHQRVTRQGPLDWQETISYMVDAASGLEHAHQRGLIHRDVKPGNLMLDAGRIKITDLGLAVLTEETEDGFTEIDDSTQSHPRFRTQYEMLCGTADFMAPEQARSLESASIQSDIYGLGATWFYLLTGTSRVTGRKMRDKVVNLIRGVGLKPLPESVAPAKVRSVCEKMFAYRPEDRYMSMTEVKEALQALISDRPGTAPKSCIDVMIVEDDQDDLVLTVEMLQRGNKAVNVVAFNKLCDAIAADRDVHKLDLVLLDLQLPDSQGVQTVTSIRKRFPKVPVIVLTGQEDATVGKACIAAGADDFACKNDLTPHLLERIIFVTLSRHSRRNPSEEDFR